MSNQVPLTEKAKEQTQQNRFGFLLSGLARKVVDDLVKQAGRD
jgi:hypothetical protein